MVVVSRAMKGGAARNKKRDRSRVKRPSDSQFGAFTLIELLIVVAILAILAALLLPALSRAKEQGKRAVCASNLHQLALAFTLYAEEDSAQRYPTSWLASGAVKTMYALDGSTATNLIGYGITDNVTNSVWHCPSTTPGRGWFSGPTRLALDNYSVQTQMRNQPGYSGSLSPTKVGDPVGPLVSDQIYWWDQFDPTWGSNHARSSRKYDPDGYNQAFSDGRVSWYSRSAFPGAPTSSWIYDPDGSGGWAYWYWVEN